VTPERWQRVKELFAQAKELAPAARPAFLASACGDDRELRDEVESLLAADPGTGVGLDRPAAERLASQPLERPDDHWVGQRVGAYEILARIGRGGMGEVYRARRADAQFDKEVAIKLVRAGYDTSFVLERFKAERQILAGLEHPGIARLLDGGVTDAGLPFLVMELVDGEPIDAYCERHALPLAARLRLFRAVCAAVSYAHQHLVVHRDLKPANILVTADGTVKLLDFGIAKLLEGPSGEIAGGATVTAFTALTPAFSSPEQVLGLPITTASDVYSLGVVLFHLLTGRSPYRERLVSTQDAIRHVVDTEPVTPSAAAREAPPAGGQRLTPDRDLDDITLKALRKEPRHRYASVEQLSEDIERYLTGQPVAAHGDQFSYRAGKFVRRHKVEIGAAAVVALALVGGVVAAGRAASIARQQAEIARAERARAERRLEDIRKISDTMIFDIHDAIQNLPGATPARKLLLDRAVEYLDTIAKDSGGDPNVERELAWGYQRLAVVQGNPTESNLGDAAAAIASDRKALAHFEVVAKANPANLIDQLNVAMMHRILSYSELTLPEGRTDLEQAMAISARVLAADPTNPKPKSERSIEFQNLALMREGAGDRAGALAAYRQCRDLKLDLLRTNPDYRGIRRSVAVATVMLATALARSGERAEALKLVDEGIAYMSSEPKGRDEINSRRDLAISKQRRAEILLMNGDIAGAQAGFDEVRRVIEPMAKADPENSMLQIDRAGLDFNAGRLLLATGRVRDAIAKLDRSVRTLHDEHGAQPASEDVPEGAVAVWLGDAYAAAGDRAHALESYRGAIALLSADATEKNDDNRVRLATAHVHLGAMLAATHDADGATRAYSAALKLTEAANVAAYRDVPALDVQAAAYAGLAALEAAGSRAAQTKAERAQLAADAQRDQAQASARRALVPNPGWLSPSGFLESLEPRRVAAARQRAQSAIEHR